MSDQKTRFGIPEAEPTVFEKGSIVFHGDDGKSNGKIIAVEGDVVTIRLSHHMPAVVGARVLIGIEKQ
jgi:hypothetical protein